MTSVQFLYCLWPLKVQVFWNVILCHWTSRSLAPSCSGSNIPRRRIAWTWRWRYYGPSKCWELLTQQDSVRFRSSTTLLWEPQILHPCCSVLKPYTNMLLTLHLTAVLQILSMWLQTGPIQLWSILVPTGGEKTDMLIYFGKQISGDTYTGERCHCRWQFV
jgi:hypothetical protein